MRPSRHARRARGFTLVELMVATVVSAVVIVGVVSTVLSQQKTYYAGQRQRASQSSARAALGFMEQRLALAGYGIDPAFAIDLDRYTTGPCPTTFDACLRDATDNADEIVSVNRNPDYWIPSDPSSEPRGKAWKLSATSATTFTISARLGDSFLRGQVLQAVCRGGKYYAYAQVKTYVPPLAADNATLAIELEDVDASNPYRRQDLTYGTASGSDCFSSGLARVFQIDRYRFHVRPVLVRTDGSRNIYDPYLVLDMGVTTGTGAVAESDEIVVAEGIELLQVAYVLANSALPTPAVGLTPGTAIAIATAASGTPTGSTTESEKIRTTLFPGAAPTGRDSVYLPSSFLSYPLGPPVDAARTTNHQANIRAVRLAVVARSAEADNQSRSGLRLDAAFQLYNLSTLPHWISDNDLGGDDGYQRTLAESTVLLPNMLARGLPYF